LLIPFTINVMVQQLHLVAISSPTVQTYHITPSQECPWFRVPLAIPLHSKLIAQ